MPTRPLVISIWAVSLLAVLTLAQASPQDPTSSAVGIELYEKKIRPLFAEQCSACHGPAQQLSGLRLDRSADIRKGGNRGSMLSGDTPEKSVLLKAIGYSDIHLRMPPKAKLKDEEIAAVAQWVKMGAPMPEDKGKDARGKTQDSKDKGKGVRKDEWGVRLQHWAYQPVRRPAVPSIQNPRLVLSGANGSKIQNPVDSFLLAEMRKKGLQPAPPANRRTLIRRVTFDLIGLPPTPAEVNAFLADKRPDAYERLVNRLLASPRYGERWGRHWLDLVRYSETLGHEFDYDLYNAWRYRDYVIRAFNADVPFNEFVMEQVAGDLLPNPRRNPANGSNESVVGTAFWWMGEGKHSPVDVRQEQADRMDNQIDVFGKAFLGQTLACARCHDHKFDPITQKDYYALAGYLRSSRYQQAFLDAPERISAKAQKLDVLREKARGAYWEAAGSKDRALARYLVAAARLPGTETAGSPILQSIARENGLDSAQLARWAQALRAPESAQPDHPLYALSRLAPAERMPFTERVAALREELQRRETEIRQASTGSEVFEDFAADDFDGWRATGDAFGSGPTQAGTLRYDGKGLTPVPPGVAHSGLSSDRLEGVLRSKSFTIEKPYILVRAAGRDSYINVVIDGFQLIRDPIYGPCHLEMNDDRMGWRVMDMSLWKGKPAYIELVDSTVPTLTHAGAEAAEGRLSKGYLAVDEIRFSDTPTPPPAQVDPANLAVLEGSVDSLGAVAARYEELLVRACCSMGDSGARERKLDGLAVTLAQVSGVSVPAAGFAEIETSIPAPEHVPALVDGPGEDESIFLRGNYKTPGGKAPRALVQVCARNQPAAPTAGSGRLEMAKRLVSPDNPLFARVIVNRVWLHHFGEGIVRSPDDFGHMGQRPTHPALLDWLAAAFSAPARSGKGPLGLNWSLKALHRLLVTSAAYRMSSMPSARAAHVDPQNKLLSHMPVRRLEAEAIRDSTLSVSGRLDGEMFGPGVLTYLTPFMEGRGKPASGPLDGDGRRSIYIAVRRNFLTPMFLAFDYPTPFSCMGRRSVSNVPAQALALMNGAFVLQQARRWAERTLADRSLDSPGKRIRSLYLSAYSRPPTVMEEKDALSFLGEQARRYQCEPDDPRVWADLCHVMFNVKEFIFVR